MRVTQIEDIRDAAFLACVHSIGPLGQPTMMHNFTNHDENGYFHGDKVGDKKLPSVGVVHLLNPNKVMC